jgi:hypothetical protein
MPKPKKTLARKVKEGIVLGLVGATLGSSMCPSHLPQRNFKQHAKKVNVKGQLNKQDIKKINLKQRLANFLRNIQTKITLPRFRNNFNVRESIFIIENILRQLGAPERFDIGFDKRNLFRIDYNEIRRNANQSEEIVQEIFKQLIENNLTNPTTQYEAILFFKTIHDVVNLHLLLDKKNPRVTNFVEAFQRGSRDCDVGSFFYIDVARRLGLPVKMAIRPGHAFVVFDAPYLKLGWESTRGVARRISAIDKILEPGQEKEVFYHALYSFLAGGGIKSNRLFNYYTEFMKSSPTLDVSYRSYAKMLERRGYDKQARELNSFLYY